MTVRHVTAVDRLLAYSDRADRAAGLQVRARRRTHRRVGKLDLVVIEESGKPTVVYLTTGDGEDSANIVEATADEVLQAADVVREVLESRPPTKRRGRGR